jgi:D-aspartate ligase
MQTFDTSTPVVVLRPDHHGSLCLIRSLERMGVPIYGVGSQPHSAGMLSRFCRKKFITDTDATSMGGLVESLREVSQKIGGRPILTCTNDISSTFIADHSEARRECFLFPDNSRELVHSLGDNKQMYILCKKFGIRAVETIFPNRG